MKSCEQFNKEQNYVFFTLNKVSHERCVGVFAADLHSSVADEVGLLSVVGFSHDR